MNRLIENKNGFSLVEIMISAGVVSLALISVVGANMMMQQSTEAAFERSMAIQEVNQVIDRIRNAANTAETFPDDVIAAFPDNTAVDGFTNLNAQCGANGVTNSCNWPFSFSSSAASNEQVVVSYADTAANPLEVTVTVVWRERGIRPAATALKTYVTQRTISAT